MTIARGLRIALPHIDISFLSLCEVEVVAVGDQVALIDDGKPLLRTV